MTDRRVGAEQLGVLLGAEKVPLRTSAAWLNVIQQQQVGLNISNMELQVLLPTLPPAINTTGMHLEVMVLVPYTVSLSDGETLVQAKHTDGAWRPLQLNI